MCSINASVSQLYEHFISILLSAGQFRLGIDIIVQAKRHNKSEKPFGYPKRYPKSDIRNIDFRYPKHFVFLTYKHIARQVLISERRLTELDWFFCNYPLQFPTTQLTPIVIADQCQSTPDSNIDHCRTLSDFYCYR